MIVTIDGPAGAGKSSVARALALRLGFRFLDTGAMYRTVALALLDNDWDQLPEQEAAKRTANLPMEFDDDGAVRLNGRDVTSEIRSLRVTKATRLAADNPYIREQLVGLQQQLAAGRNVVSEGRDQGTVAFPNAECKIFLTASPRERAPRRQIELMRSGVEMSWEKVLQQINERDKQDQEREVGRLMQADDAILISTDGLNQDQVVDKLEQAVQSCRDRSTSVES